MRPSLVLYNLGLLLGAVFGAPFWLLYMLAVAKARAGFWEKLGLYAMERHQKVAARDGRKRVWLHAVSVGEFNALRPLVADLRGEFDVVISTTTRTGQELARKTFPELAVVYFPFDFRISVMQAVRLIRPDLMVVAETELWPNFIDVVTRRFGIPMLLINGRLSKRSAGGYGRIKFIMKPALRQVTHLYMQAQGDADRIQALGDLRAEQLTVVGNIKFDIVPTVDPVKRAILKHLLSFDADPVLVFASTHSGEDRPLLDIFTRLRKDFPEIKLVLAPRHPERVSEIRKILNERALHYSLRSQLNESNPNRQPVVVLDTIGELVTVYSLASVAVMGGSFVERGGQNPIEPLSQQIPVIFGPHMTNFTEISRMILENEAGFQVNEPGDLIDVVTRLITQPEETRSVVENGQRLLENNRGAKEIIAQAIREHLTGRPVAAIS